MEQHTTQKNWFDKYYKIWMIIPILLLVLCLVYLGNFYSKNGEIILKDVSLSGGTTITINHAENINFDNLESQLKIKYPDISTKKLSDLRTGKAIAFIIESASSPENLKSDVESILGFKLTDENSSIEFSGSSLGQGFYRQLVTALIISFILMSLVILIMFRTFVPSIGVIFAAFSNIVMPLAIIDYFGIKLSAAGIAAFLMIIGYSVDVNILLTTRAIRNREGHLNTRIYGAFKTGILMTLTALFAVLPAFFLVTGLPDSFKQIFLILGLGLGSDIINTWMTNAGIIKWYCTKHNIT